MLPRLRQTPARSRHGFALIVAMVLMSFTLLLLLVLGAMTQVEIHYSSINRVEVQARQNALLGLNVALGQLQVTVGPDQRVTGTGELAGASTDEQSCWTGVWRTDRDAPDYDASQEPVWLVSNTGGLPRGNLTAATLVDAMNMTRDYSNLSTGQSLAATQAGKVTVGDSGAYAYWISDEGVKAKVSLVDSEDAGDPDAMSRHAVAPERFGMEAIASLQEMDFGLPAAGRITQLSDMGLYEVGGVSPTSEAVFLLGPDLTAQSFSVLADVKHGGLKKDLTAGLQAGAPEPSGQIFEPQLSATATEADPGGPAWEQLRSYYNIRPNADGAYDVQEQLDNQMGVYPVMAGMQFYFAPSYQIGQWSKPELYEHFIPAIVLWNPYSVPLASQDYVVQFGRVSWTKGKADADSAKNENLYFGEVFYSLRYQRQVEPGTPNAEDWNGFSFEGGSVNDWPHYPGFGFLNFTIKDTAFAPGEVKVFTPPAWHTEYDNQVGYTVRKDSDNALEEGWRPGATFYQRHSAFKNLFKAADKSVLTQIKPTYVGRRDFAWRLALYDPAKNLDDSEPLQVALMLNAARDQTASVVDFEVELLNVDQPLVQLDNFMGYKSVMRMTDNAIATGYAKPAWLGQFNPRAPYSGSSQDDWQAGSAGDPIAFTNTNPSLNASYLSHADVSQGYLVDYEVPYDTSKQSPFIGYTEGNSPVNQAILYELPGESTLFASLGQLSHANLSRFNRRPGDDQRNYTRDIFQNARFQNMLPAYAIGNSLANPRIGRTQVYDDMSTQVPDAADAVSTYDFDGLLYDYSYLLNDALWDRYFFSTVPHDGSLNLAGDLPSSRMKVTPVDADTADALRDYDRAAANLMLDGGFNINSTSVEAWAALLGSFFGQPMKQTSGAFTTLDRSAPLPRGEQLWGEAFTVETDGSNSPTSYTGYRALSRDEIQTLAGAIVEQVKMRGPFLSVADFVNRSLDNSAPENWNDPDADFPYEWNAKGVLQAALDRASLAAADAGESSLNAPFYKDGLLAEQTDLSGDSLAFPEAEAMPRAAQAPGYLSQVDLLYRLGSVMTARSDTFVIRAYGEVKDPLTGKPLGTAWCEATVQRYPDFMDASSDPDPEVSLDTLSNLNRQLGRGLKVVSFRWLKSESGQPPAPELES